MYFKNCDLRKDVYKWNVFEMIHSRRVADTEMKRINTMLPAPEEGAMPFVPPDWVSMPIYQKIPMPWRRPPQKIEFTRGTLGENIIQGSSETFDLRDPYLHDLKMEYEPIHDKHLKHYLLAPHIKKYIVDLGTITDDNKVRCDLRSFNSYRHYIYSIHRYAIREALQQEEKYYMLRQNHHLLLKFANTAKERVRDVARIQKQVAKRKIARILEEMLTRMLKDLRILKLNAGLERVENARSDNWIIHLAKKKTFPELIAGYAERAFLRWVPRIVHLFVKLRDHAEWEEKRVEIREQCHGLKEIADVLYWKKKIKEQCYLLTRDFVIYNDYRKYSAKRLRKREMIYNLDRTAMEGKFLRLRYSRDYSIIKKWIKNQKYQMAANFLTKKLGYSLKMPWWETVNLGPKAIPNAVILNNKGHIIKSLTPLRNFGTWVHTFFLKRLYTSKDSIIVSEECITQLVNNYTFRRVLSYSASCLGRTRKHLRGMVARLRNNMTLPRAKFVTFKMRYEKIRRLPFKAVADNWPAEVIVRKKLCFAVRRFMKHERRRIRMARKCPEWSYYKKHSSKYRLPGMYRYSIWRKLNTYFPLVSEQYHCSDWHHNCKSLGKRLLYILINNQSFNDKRRKICAPITTLKAVVLKMKSKVRILVDVLMRKAGKKIRLYYPKYIKKHIELMRTEVRNMLPKYLWNGDGYIRGVATMVACMSLYHIYAHHLIPFANILLLYSCFPRRFPLFFKKYPINLYRRQEIFTRMFYYRRARVPRISLQRRVCYLKRLSRRSKRWPALVRRIHNRDFQKYVLLQKQFILKPTCYR